MQVSWNWLGEHVDLEGLTPTEVAHRLTMGGLEVESVTELGGQLDGVVVGRVVTCAPHPDADSLSVCEVDVGADEPLAIVCGAPNVAAGVFAPVATIGTTLPGGLKIKKGKLRGQPSNGMLCSAVELEVSEDADGLLLLPEQAPGTPIADSLGLRDTVIEIGVTPNRGDALSIIGVARDVAALLGRARRQPASRATVTSTGDVSSLLSVSIEDPEGCPRYAAAVVEDVRIGPSPSWMQQRLRAVGQRPVNNIVDVTNYVLFEYGQPLHAFDLDHLHGATLTVRRAGTDASIETLDGAPRALESGDLLICDAQRPVAVAGVMGGADSEISDRTTRIAIECANFAPSTVRRTKQRLKLYTESSYRFERGVDQTAIPEVLARTLELVVATQDALGQACHVASGQIDLNPTPYVAPVIALDPALPGALLGVEVSEELATTWLTRLGLGVTRGANALEVTIPAYRPDLVRPVDLVEEIGRCIGFDALPSEPVRGELGIEPVARTSAPVAQERNPRVSSERLAQVERLRDVVAAFGYFEAVNWAMTDPRRLALLGEAGPLLTLQNPLGVESSVMRTTLLAGLLDNVAFNLARGAERVALFEIGSVFPNVGVVAQNDEPQRIGAVLTGLAEQGWSGSGRKVDGHDIAALVALVGEAIGHPLTVMGHEDGPPSYAHPSVSARVVAGGIPVGWVGGLHPTVLDGWGIEAPVFALELSLDAAFSEVQASSHATEPPRTPASRRDVSLEVDQTVTYASVVGLLSALGQKYFEQFEVFDVYEGERLPPGRKSIALRMTYRDPNGSLTDKQVEKAHQRIVGHLVEELGATQR
jgi:phenylalanyl-tRNA synthetase beta chain